MSPTLVRTIRIASIAVIALVLGSIAGWYIHIRYTNSLPSRLIEVRKNSPEYRFINPLLLVDAPRQSPEFNGLKKSILSFIASKESSGDAKNVSVYIRNVNLGKWMGIDEDAVYDPSSMLKVAVMIGYLNEAQSDPTILDKFLPYKSVSDPGQYFKPDEVLSNGQHTVKELINAMIKDSDNDALASLYAYNRASFVEVLKELQIPPPPTVDTTDFVSAKEYSTIFRTLYSSSYLDTAFSEEALKILSETDFTQGLVAGVPAGVTVSHKFGEHTTLANSSAIQSRQLHDCGIVYLPNDPYFICVMTRGSSFEQLEAIISGISRITYDAMSSGSVKLR